MLSGRAILPALLCSSVSLFLLSNASPVGPPRSQTPPSRLSILLRQVFSIGFPTYTLSATPVEIPSSPAAARQQTLSVFAANTDFSDATSAAVIQCFAANTSTDSSVWGLFNAVAVSETLIQAEYYVNAPVASVTSAFHKSVTTFAKDQDGLTACVREFKGSDVSSTGIFFQGRSSGDREAVTFESTDARIIPWIGAVVIAAFTVLALLAVFVFSAATSTNKYSPSDYADNDSYRDEPESPRSSSHNSDLCQLAGC
jgi:hypothetical protein